MRTISCVILYILNEKKSGRLSLDWFPECLLLYTVSTQQPAYNTKAGRPSLSIHIFIEGTWQRIDGASFSLYWSVIDEAQHQEEEGKKKKTNKDKKGYIRHVYHALLRVCPPLFFSTKQNTQKES